MIFNKYLDCSADLCCRTSYEEENIYAKVDDMTYYPVVSPQFQQQLDPVGVDTATLPTKHAIINNFLATDQLESKTLNLHQGKPVIGPKTLFT